MDNDLLAIDLDRRGHLQDGPHSDEREDGPDPYLRKGQNQIARDEDDRYEEEEEPCHVYDNVQDHVPPVRPVDDPHVLVMVFLGINRRRRPYRLPLLSSISANISQR